MKFKKILIFIALSLIILSTTTYSKPMSKLSPIFLGKVKEVTREADGSYRLLVLGYIKGCEIYSEELITFITPETKILTSLCGEKENMVKLEDLIIDIGDNVYLVLNDAMTKSIPPQVAAKKIQLTKAIKE